MTAPDAAVLHLGDCMEFMKGQPDGSYDIIITDPPYEATDLKFDKAGTVPWAALSRELLRVLKPAGWLFVFGNLMVTRHFIDDWRFKFEYVWLKNAPVLASAAAVRPYYRHETINAFVNPGLKRITDLFFDPGAITVEGKRYRVKQGRFRMSSEYGDAHGWRRTEKHPYDSYLNHPTTVLRADNKITMRAAERTDHPTQKPVSIYETLLQGYCPPDGLALDPFGGSGTMAIAAMNTGRRYHLAELNPEYHAMIEERVARHVPRLETARRQQTMTAHLQEAAQ